jgi:hypothetical protein
MSSVTRKKKEAAEVLKKKILHPAEIEEEVGKEVLPEEEEIVLQERVVTIPLEEAAIVKD